MTLSDLPGGCPSYLDGRGPHIPTRAEIAYNERERRREWEEHYREIARAEDNEYARWRNALARTHMIDGKWVVQPKTKSGERRIANGEDPYDVYGQKGKVCSY